MSNSDHNNYLFGGLVDRLLLRDVMSMFLLSSEPVSLCSLVDSVKIPIGAHSHIIILL